MPFGYPAGAGYSRGQEPWINLSGCMLKPASRRLAGSLSNGWSDNRHPVGGSEEAADPRNGPAKLQRRTAVVAAPSVHAAFAQAECR